MNQHPCEVSGIVLNLSSPPTLLGMERWRIRTSHKVTPVFNGRSWARIWGVHFLRGAFCTGRSWRNSWPSDFFPCWVCGEENRLTEMPLVGGQMHGFVAVGWTSLPTCDPLFPFPLPSCSQHQAELPAPNTGWGWRKEPEDDYCQPCPHGEGVQGYEWTAEVLFLFCSCPFGRNLPGERHQGLRTEARTPPTSEVWLFLTHTSHLAFPFKLWQRQNGFLKFLSFLCIYLTRIVSVLNHWGKKSIMVTAVLFTNLISNWTSCMKASNRMIATPTHNCRLKIVDARLSLGLPLSCFGLNFCLCQDNHVNGRIPSF